MKECFKCGVAKPLGEFYRHPRMADGHFGKCKVCAAADARANWAAKREYYCEFDRLRLQLDPKRREQHALAGAEHRRKYPEKVKARKVAWFAIRDGRLKREACEVCGEEAEAHHEDYSKPLEVRWLCMQHHRATHQMSNWRE